MANKPICAGCGNDGSEGGLYLTIDAKWDGARGGWILEEREDNGGGELDCLACDHRTPVSGEEVGFPYDILVKAEG